VLGASVQLPTPGGRVQLRVPPGTRAGQSLRLGGRGLPHPHGEAGNLYAMVQIVVPPAATDKEKSLYRELAENARFDPRSHFEEAGK
jgi:curved DNA-binding protein